MPFDGAADFAAGVCASAIKPANEASTSPMKKALMKFMLAFVFRTSRRVQSHQIDRQLGQSVTTSKRRRVRGRAGSPLHAAHKTALTELSPCPMRGPSAALCPTRVRSEHNRRFFRPPPRRDRRYG